jgi:isopenicillin N synthase-like dioxygenase
MPPNEKQAMGEVDVVNDCNEVPVIDLCMADNKEEVIIQQIAQACVSPGFFQVINHGVPASTMSNFRQAMEHFFALPQATKNALKRNERNARGYFDDELTKQRRDWKEALDVGMPGSGSWDLDDDDPKNACLDGFNQFPSSSDSVDVEPTLPTFRQDVIDYFKACEELSYTLAKYMSLGLDVDVDVEEDSGGTCTGDDGTQNSNQSSNINLANQLRDNHTSYLRMNHYPPCACRDDDNENDDENHQGQGPQPQQKQTPLGISPHTDAGFLTVLLQDDDCHSLQVAKHRKAGDNTGDSLQWMPVTPVPGALTINTGDMCCIWSDGRYKPPLHRVLTNKEKKRYSAPFFYNPPYDASIIPLPSLLKKGGAGPAGPDCADESDTRLYTHPCVWGYFRAVRFAGDLTDLGAEIQISDYAKGTTSKNPARQVRFLRDADFQAPFSVERYRPLLTDDDA